MYDKLIQLSSKKVLFIVLSIFVVFLIGVLPFIANMTTQWIGVADSPDTAFGGNLDFYYNIRDLYGERGRRIYVILRFTFDLIWPLVYGSFLVVSITYLIKGNVSKMYLVWVPIIGVLLDYLENIIASIFMLTYPSEFDFLIRALILVSTLKWVFVTGGFVVIIVLIIYLIIKKISHRK